MGVAARPADQSHPYGHGRFETLSAFAVGVILAAAGVLIGYHSLQAVGAQHPPPATSAMAALVFAIVLRSIMSTVKCRVGRQLHSSALVADAWNDAVDILSAFAAFIAVALAAFDPVRLLAADHYGGFVVGVVVVLTGMRVLRDASLELVDTMPAPALTSEVERVAASVAGVRGPHRPGPAPPGGRRCDRSEPKRDPRGRASQVVVVVAPIENRQPAEVCAQGQPAGNRNEHATAHIERTIRCDAARNTKDARDLLLLDGHPSRAESDQPKGTPAGVPKVHQDIAAKQIGPP